MKTVPDGNGDHASELDVVATSASQLIDRLRRVLLPEDLDCACREMLSGALARFDEQERRREMRRRLAGAREHKERIASILHFLSELDALTEAESDRTVFEEFALLFVEITRSGEAAVSALRGL